MLEEFLDSNVSLFTDDYVFLAIDVEEMEHGAATAERLRKSNSGGIPWMVILDSDGNELINADGPNGNIGCPIGKQEQEYFLHMIRQTIQHAPADRVDKIAQALAEFAKKHGG